MSNKRTNNLYFTTNGRFSGFDKLFNNGRLRFPSNSPLVMVLKGSEGTGKSTLALQLSCLGQIRESDNCAQGRPTRCVIYCVTDEIKDRIIEKYQTFNLGEDVNWPVTLPENSHPDECWSSDEIAESISPCQTNLFIVSSFEMKKTLSSLASNIRDKITTIKAKSVHTIDEFIVVIDSITTFKKECLDRIEEVEAGEWGFELDTPPVIILLDENQTSEEPNRDPYLSNVYIRLWQGDDHDIDNEKGYCERYLQILKASNCPHIRGPQFFRIQDGHGLEIYPSLAAYYELLRHSERPVNEIKNISFGNSGLDTSLESFAGVEKGKGAIPRGSCNLLIGEHGTSKTPLSYYFVKEALSGDDPNEKAIFLSFHDTPAQIENYLRLLGIINHENESRFNKCSFPDAILSSDFKDDSCLIIQQMTSWFTPPEVFLTMLLRLFEKMNVKPDGSHKCRIIFDSISDFNMSYPRLTGRKGFLAVLVSVLRTYGVTSLFTFDESSFESHEDKVIASLADNVFHLYRRSISGKTSTMLHVEQIGNRLTSIEDIMQLRRVYDTDSNIESIEVEECKESYTKDSSQQLVPVNVKLFVNNYAPSHKKFDEEICRAHGLDVIEDLDLNLLKQRGDAYLQNIETIKANENASVIMAVDEYNAEQESVRKHFIELDIESLGEGKLQRDEFLGISSHNEGDNHVHLLPSLLDCTVAVCNIDILKRISTAETKALNSIMKIIRDAQKKYKNRIFTEEEVSHNSLPEISWRVLEKAAEEFNIQSDNNYNYIGFEKGDDLEALVALFLHYWSILNSPISNNKSNEINIAEKTKNSIETMTRIFMKAYQILFSRKHGPKSPLQPENCLFYYTWHSILYPSSHSYLVPFRLTATPAKNSYSPNSTDQHCKQSNSSLRDDWMFTRGGYYWGILDNGLCSKKAKHILHYASNKTMNLFRITERVGIPPQKQFHINTGELSIYNLKLMGDIFKKSWSRSKYKNYDIRASYIRAFISEYLSFIMRKQISLHRDRTLLENWLKRYLGELVKELTC